MRFVTCVDVPTQTYCEHDVTKYSKIGLPTELDKMMKCTKFIAKVTKNHPDSSILNKILLKYEIVDERKKESHSEEIESSSDRSIEEVNQ